MPTQPPKLNEPINSKSSMQTACRLDLDHFGFEIEFSRLDVGDELQRLLILVELVMVYQLFPFVQLAHLSTYNHFPLVVEKDGVVMSSNNIYDLLITYNVQLDYVQYCLHIVAVIRYTQLTLLITPHSYNYILLVTCYHVVYP